MRRLRTTAGRTLSADPWNGRGQPTYEQALLIPGLRKSVSQIATPGLQVPYSYQTSIGFQRQLRSDMGVEADYVYNASRAELFQMNINLTYDPVTGVLNPSTNAALAVRPDWGTVNAYHSQGWSNYHALQTAFTKRFNQRWQLSGTYTLSAFWDGTPSPAPQINLVEDLGRQVLVGRHGPAPPRRRQRHLGCGTRPAVERPLLLRIGSARRNHLRRRRSSQTAHGWPAGGHHCSAEQPRGRLASPGGSPGPATRQAPRAVREWMELLKCSTCSIARTTALIRPLKAIRTMESRFRMLVLRISRAWCNWDSGSHSDSRLCGPALDRRRRAFLTLMAGP